MPVVANHTKFDTILKELFMPTINKKADFHIYRMEDLLTTDSPILLPSFRQRFYDITFTLNGDYNYSYGDKRTKVFNDTLNLLGPNHIQALHATTDTLKILKGFTIYFKPEFLGTHFDNTSFCADFPFFSHANLEHLVPLRKVESLKIKESMEWMLRTYKGQEPSKMYILQNYLQALLFQIKDIWGQHDAATNNLISSDNIVVRFQAAIAKHCTARMQIRDFADMLCLSPKHLSAKIKSETGLTAKDYFDQLLLTDIKTQMLHSPTSISEIAYRVGFNDLSSFSKFFKRMTGKSPQVYRMTKTSIL